MMINFFTVGALTAQMTVIYKLVNTTGPVK